MPQGGPPAPGPGPMPEGHAPLQAGIMAAHGQAAAQVGKLKQATAMAGHISGELDTLAAMGDQVTPEDVIKGAGVLVGHGADPMQMATLLADMPQGGEALASWLQQHAQQLQQTTAGLQQQLAVARHTAGVAALHGIAMHHIGQQFGAVAPPAPQPGDQSNG